VSLKSTQGPIDVFLCPEDSSGVCSPVTGASPSKPDADPSLVPPPTPPADQSHGRSSAAAEDAASSSPASTSSTVTATSQQDPSAMVLGGDAGERSHVSVNARTFIEMQFHSQKFIQPQLGAGQTNRGVRQQRVGCVPLLVEHRGRRMYSAQSEA